MKRGQTLFSYQSPGFGDRRRPFIRPTGRTLRQAALAGLLLLLVVNAAAADCSYAIAGSDTAGWNTASRTFLGKAVGQTFYAADTIITRITVWRYPDNLNYGGDHLFVTTVDTVNYIPGKPITQGILQDGPAVYVVDSNPPGLPIRMDFFLNPPLVLPHSGVFAFFIQREGCDAGETAILARQPGAYPYGTNWTTSRTSFLPCYLPSVDGWVEQDLCFEMEFCKSTSTQIRDGSWGRLKVIYR